MVYMAVQLYLDSITAKHLRTYIVTETLKQSWNLNHITLQNQNANKLKNKYH